MSRIPLIALIAASLMCIRCGSTDSGDAAGGSGGGGGENTGAGGSNANGTTPCGTFAGAPKQCIAGQYCKDETLSICESGCLSNTNCATNQVCTKSDGNNLGTCQNTVTNSCDGFVAKCKACNPNATDAQCEQQCQQVSAACAACAVDASCWEVDTVCQSACAL